MQNAVRYSELKLVVLRKIRLMGRLCNDCRKSTGKGRVGGTRAHKTVVGFGFASDWFEENPECLR